jgi:hypothetical protein
LVALGLLSLVGSAHARVYSFPTISILGANEVPAISSDGSATAEVIYNDVTNTIYWTVNYVLDSGSTSLTLAHFHGPAAPGVGAGIQVNMAPSVSSASGFWSGSAVISEGQEADLLAGLYYINLHSNVETGGELRGQCLVGPATRSYDDRPVDSTQETSAVTGSPGISVLNAAYDEASNDLTFAVTWNTLTGPVTAAHFHGPGGVGVSAPPLVFVHTLPGFDLVNASGIFVGTVNLSPTEEGYLTSDQLYINLHTGTNTNGEVRGQVNSAVAVPVELSIFQSD